MSKKSSQKKPLNKALRFTGAGLQMGVTIYLFNWLGKWLDQKYAKDFLETSCTLFAIFASMYAIIRQVLKISNDND